MISDLPGIYLWVAGIILRGKSVTHCEPRTGYAWFKTFKRFKPFKMSEKQSGAVERSAAIERLERFEPAPLLDAIARDRRGFLLSDCPS
jgi:hypothetical protein